MARPEYFDYLIVGGGVAGVTAAEAIRAKDKEGKILILSHEQHPLYSRVLLPNYIRRKIEREKIFLRTWEQYQALRIDVSVGADVIGVNYETREVTTSRSDVIAYGKMLIATGGTPQPWAINGIEFGTVLRLQTVEDADTIRNTLPALQKKGQPAFVVGGGFIGLEFIETAVSYGFETHLFLRDKWLFSNNLDEQGWEMLGRNYERNRVHIHASTEVKYLEADPDGFVGHTNTSEKIKGSWIGIGVGVSRNFAPFSMQGLEVGRGIKANQYLETTMPHVWTAGDVAEYYDVMFDEHRLVGNWTNAFLQGRIAGSNMAANVPEERTELRAVSTYSITNLGYQFTFVGKTTLEEGMHDIVRMVPDSSAYERLFFKGGVLQGAVLINRFVSKGPITALITSRKDLSGIEESLKDPYVEIAQFV